MFHYAANLYIGSLIFILVVAVWLIFDRRYDDGCLGRIALGIMVVACSLTLWERFTTEVDRLVAPTTSWLAFAFAIFMLRHAYRHLRFGRKRVLATGEHVHA